MKGFNSAKDHLQVLVRLCSSKTSLSDINCNTLSTANSNPKAMSFCSNGRNSSLHVPLTPTKNGRNLSSSSFQENDSVFYSAEYQEEMQTTVGLVRDYVVCRLKKSGFTTRVYVTGLSPSKDPALLHPILMAGHTFETLQPDLFSSLSRKIGYVFDSEQTVRRLYFRLATHIMGLGKRNYTWSRILALFCLAGAVAVDCVSQGHSDLVEETIKVASDFIKQTVLEWVVDKGGWKAMGGHFTKSRKPVKNSWCDITLSDSAISRITVGLIALSVLSFLGIEFFL